MNLTLPQKEMLRKIGKLGHHYSKSARETDILTDLFVKGLVVFEPQKPRARYTLTNKGKKRFEDIVVK